MLQNYRINGKYLNFQEKIPDGLDVSVKKFLRGSETNLEVDIRNLSFHGTCLLYTASCFPNVCKIKSCRVNLLLEKNYMENPHKLLLRLRR